MVDVFLHAYLTLVTFFHVSSGLVSTLEEGEVQ